MGTEISKQFLPLCGKEILAHSVEKFEKAEKINKVYVKYDLITPLNEEILDQMFDKRSTKRRVADAILRRIRNVCARIVKVFK